MESFSAAALLENARVIETPSQLDKFLREISHEKFLGVDTESAGFHKYHQGVNLIQIATKSHAAILDPQAIRDFSSLQNFAADHSREWIFHGGDFDIRLLARELGLFFKKFFDTRIAAELIGLGGLGLNFLVNHFLGVNLDKKLQRCDWSKRPLTNEMKTYGLLDAIYLLAIRDFLFDELKTSGRLEWALEEFAFSLGIFQIQPPKKENLFAFQIKGAGSLNKRSLAILNEIWQLREKISKELDRAPFMVLGNSTLLEIAIQAPGTIDKLSGIKGIGKSCLSRYGDLILSAVRKGGLIDLISFQTKPRKRREKRALSGSEGELLKTLRLTRDTISKSLRLPGHVLVSASSLDSLVRFRPQTFEDICSKGGLRRWQANLVSQSFLPMLAPKPTIVSDKPTRNIRRKSGGKSEY